MAKQEKKEVAVQATGHVAMFSDQAPEWAKNGTGRGSENVGTKDIMLPRLEIIQAQSPIKDENPDARDGLLFNTVTGEILGEEAFVVPVFYRMEYLVWKDQDAGGGFFGAYDTENEARARISEEASNGEDPTLLEVVDTPVHYCLCVNPDMTTQQIVISMSKSKAKVSRKWNAVIQICGGDRFARAYKLTTFKDKNKQNKTFFNYVVQPAGFPPEAIYREAERLYNVFKTQGVKANHEAAAGADRETVDTEI
jgi:hypothetical protein